MSQVDVVAPAPRSPRSAQLHRWAAIGLVVSVICAGLLTAVVTLEVPAVMRFDQALTDWTRSWADAWGWPVEVAHTFGQATDPVLACLFGAVFFFFLLGWQRPAAAALVAVSGITGVLVSEGTKLLVSRQRPPAAAQWEEHMDKSFPSGHTMVGIYLYLLCGLILVNLARANGRTWVGRLGWVLVVMGPVIGLSRLVLGVHWPTDILAGWAFGSAVALGASLLLWDPLGRGWARPGRRGEPQLEPGAHGADGPGGQGAEDPGPPGLSQAPAA